MKCRLVLASILLFPVLAAAQELPKFETFTSKDYGFSVLFPGKPKEQELKLPSKFGDLTGKQFVATSENEKAGWMVMVADFPPGVRVPKEKQDAMLDAMVKGLDTTGKGKILSQGTMSLGKMYPGRSVLGEHPKSGGLYHARIFCVETRLYLIVILAPKEIATGSEATKFLNSFELVR